AVAVVVLVVEEDDRERLIGIRVVQEQHLGRVHPLRLFALLDLARQLRRPLGAHTVERDNTCQCHGILPWLSRRAYASEASSASAATVRQLRCVPVTPRRRSSRAAESFAFWTPEPYCTYTSLPASTPRSGE